MTKQNQNSIMQRLRIGPAGNSNSFYEQGYKKTAQAPAWLHDLGLNAMEYQLGHGASSVKEETLKEIAKNADEYDIEMSVHAPYFINLAVSLDDERVEKNLRYFLETMAAAKILNAKRVVFHPGSTSKMPREDALEFAIAFLPKIMSELDSRGFGEIALCPETMGKVNQLGDLKEVIELCKIDERLIPAIDFGHLHARELGALNSKEDFARVLDKLETELGTDRAKRMHVHFSHIEYGKSGERKHLTFADTRFGPDFLPLAELIVERDYSPHIICESAGTMAEDALAMKKMIEEFEQK